MCGNFIEPESIDTIDLHYYYLYFAALKTAEKQRKMAMFGIDWMLIQLNDVFTCQILAHTIC